VHLTLAGKWPWERGLGVDEMTMGMGIRTGIRIVLANEGGVVTSSRKGKP
jgi:hypothetical protein